VQEAMPILIMLGVIIVALALMLVGLFFNARSRDASEGAGALPNLPVNAAEATDTPKPPSESVHFSPRTRWRICHRGRRTAFHSLGRYRRRAMGSARVGGGRPGAELGRHHAGRVETDVERRVARRTCASRWGVGGRIPWTTLSPVNRHSGWRDRSPVVGHDRRIGRIRTEGCLARAGGPAQRAGGFFRGGVLVEPSCASGRASADQDAHPRRVAAPATVVQAGAVAGWHCRAS
jgi:hypothetical protein